MSDQEAHPQGVLTPPPPPAPPATGTAPGEPAPKRHRGCLGSAIIVLICLTLAGVWVVGL